MKLLLASNSPRRRELLGLLDIDFEILRPREVEEVYPSDISADEVAPYLSLLKANAYKDVPHGDEIVVTADTTVICDNQILGKPADEKEAVEMLLRLSGKTHYVVTGVTLMSQNRTDTFSEATEVHFDELSREDIEKYVAKYKPLDKAGAYGIQEWIGCTAISGIKGCYYNVMGLPLHKLHQMLKEYYL